MQSTRSTGSWTRDMILFYRAKLYQSTDNVQVDTILLKECPKIIKNLKRVSDHVRVPQSVGS